LGRCIAGYSDVLPLNIVSSETFTRHDLSALMATHFVGDHIERALSGVQTFMHLVVAPREHFTVTAGYVESMIFYTDGSLIDGCAGFSFHRTEEGGFGYKILSPAGIFTAELTVLLVPLRHIGEAIQLPEKFLILTDSLSSVKALSSNKISHRTHPLVCEFEQVCSDLLEDIVEVEIMWIPSHVGLEGNEIIDERAQHAALNVVVFGRPLLLVDFQGLTRSVLLRE
jgi:ribonuclease HI